MILDLDRRFFERLPGEEIHYFQDRIVPEAEASS